MEVYYDTQLSISVSYLGRSVIPIREVGQYYTDTTRIDYSVDYIDVENEVKKMRKLCLYLILILLLVVAHDCIQ